MLRKLLSKVLHSVDHSRHGHRRYSSSHRGRPMYGRYSSSSRKGHYSSDHHYGGGRYGHGHYKNRYGSSS